MMQTLDNVFERWDSWEEGWKEGWKEGLKEGREEVIKEIENKVKEPFILEAYKNNLDINMIYNIFKCDLSELKEIVENAGYEFIITPD